MTAPRILAATTAPDLDHLEGALLTDEETTAYTVLLATTPEEVQAAQRLRHRVFAGEMGAHLHSPVPGLDIDEFDAFCDHLLVRHDQSGEVVGTYRMLPPNRAAEAGRLYAETEFDLSALADLRSMIVETGRSCVHTDHRGGAVINLMWTGIARYLHLHGHRWLAGCASIPLDDGGASMAAVWEVVRTKHLSPPPLRVTPHRPYNVGEPATQNRAELLAAVPALLRGYLRLGAWVCGPPAHDPDFNVADLFIVLSLDRVDPRYLRHFLGTP